MFDHCCVAYDKKIAKYDLIHIFYKVKTTFSYLRFDHCCVAYDKKIAKYALSFSTLNNVIADRTPR